MKALLAIVILLLVYQSFRNSSVGVKPPEVYYGTHTTNGNSTNSSTGSSSYVDTGLTATITPQFSTSKILVIANTSIDTGANGSQGIWTVYRNGSVNIVDGSSSIVQGRQST